MEKGYYILYLKIKNKHLKRFPRRGGGVNTVLNIPNNTRINDLYYVFTNTINLLMVINNVGTHKQINSELSNTYNKINPN